MISPTASNSKKVSVFDYQKSGKPSFRQEKKEEINPVEEPLSPHQKQSSFNEIIIKQLNTEIDPKDKKDVLS